MEAMVEETQAESISLTWGGERLEVPEARPGQEGWSWAERVLGRRLNPDTRLPLGEAGLLLGMGRNGVHRLVSIGAFGRVERIGNQFVLTVRQVELYRQQAIADGAEKARGGRVRRVPDRAIIDLPRRGGKSLAGV